MCGYVAQLITFCSVYLQHHLSHKELQKSFNQNEALSGHHDLKENSPNYSYTAELGILNMV